MSRWLTALSVALVCAFGGLFLVMAVPSPYTVYSPGPTVNLLGSEKAGPYIRVAGTKAYRDREGALRLLTVVPTGPDDAVSFGEAFAAWLDPARAVFRYEDAYRPTDTPDKLREESGAEMVSSQDAATAAALVEMGRTLRTSVQVLGVRPGGPGDGALQVHDKLVTVDGRKVTDQESAVELIRSVPPKSKVRLGIDRRGERETLRLRTAESEDVPGKSALQVTIGTGYEFPFDVNVKIDSHIGGPSAGMMFALAIYDTLTPGSLTGGGDVAGTGTINADGEVGPIGGIEQKIAGAQAAGAELFLAPAWHCDEVLDASYDEEQMRIVKISTLADAIKDVTAWRKDHDVRLPECTR